MLSPNASEPAAAATTDVGEKVRGSGLEWLAPLLTNRGKVRDKLRVKEVAEIIGCSPAFAYELVSDGRLETLDHGKHKKVLTRSLMVWLWENWSGRHEARPPQITTFVLLLLGQLPSSALRAVQLACGECIASRKTAEHTLNLHGASNTVASQCAKQPEPELFAAHADD